MIRIGSNKGQTMHTTLESFGLEQGVWARGTAKAAIREPLAILDFKKYN